MSASTPLVTVVMPSFSKDPHIVRARISNFSGQHLVRRVIGIACITTPIAIPKKAQEQIFKALILKRLGL